MSITLPQVPPPPPPNVARVDAAGRPTVAQVQYEQRLLTFMQAVKAALESL